MREKMNQPHFITLLWCQRLRQYHNQSHRNLNSSRKDSRLKRLYYPLIRFTRLCSQ